MEKSSKNGHFAIENQKWAFCNMGGKKMGILQSFSIIIKNSIKKNTAETVSYITSSVHIDMPY